MILIYIIKKILIWMSDKEWLKLLCTYCLTLGSPGHRTWVKAMHYYFIGSAVLGFWVEGKKEDRRERRRANKRAL